MKAIRVEEIMYRGLIIDRLAAKEDGYLPTRIYAQTRKYATANDAVEAAWRYIKRHGLDYNGNERYYGDAEPCFMKIA